MSRLLGFERVIKIERDVTRQTAKPRPQFIGARPLEQILIHFHADPDRNMTNIFLIR